MRNDQVHGVIIARVERDTDPAGTFASEHAQTKGLGSTVG